MILDRVYSSVVCIGLGDMEKKEERRRLLMCLYPNGIMALIYEELGLYITSDANQRYLVDMIPLDVC